MEKSKNAVDRKIHNEVSKKFLSFVISVSLMLAVIPPGRQNFMVEAVGPEVTEVVLEPNMGTNDTTSEVTDEHKLDEEDDRNIIPIAMATDNNYLDVTLVSIVSALENADKDTKLKFYIMVSDDFCESNNSKIHKINSKFKNCDIEVINMGENFKEFYKGKWGTAMYYRLRLATVLKNKDKCIYLDGDTLVLGDLRSMYSLDISGYYVTGVSDYNKMHVKYGRKIKINDMSHYINSGVLLWNLAKIRNDGIENKFFEFLQSTNKENVILPCPDQDIINLVCYGKVLNMPFKYGALSGVLDYDIYEREHYLTKMVSKGEWIEAKTNPVIMHFAGPIKPWNQRCYFSDVWQKYHQALNNILEH